MNKLCPECGKELNENLNVCKNCGYKINNNQSNKKKLPVWAIILIVIACLIPIIVGIVILFVVFKFNIKTNVNTSYRVEIEYPIVLEGKAGFTEITYNEYEEKLSTLAPFVVVIVNDGCGYCELYEPIVKEVANESGLPIYYINLANLTKEERQSLANSNTYLKNNSWGTPTTLFLYGDEVIDYISGYVEEETLEDFLEDYFVMR